MISPIQTKRLHLVPAQVRHLESEVLNTGELASLLGAVVPDNWPPEILRDALGFFLEQLCKNIAAVGWNGWYWIRTATESEPAVLIGSGGFIAPPDSDGQV